MPVDLQALNKSIQKVLALKEKNLKREIKKETGGIERAISYINNNYRTNLSLARVAAEAGMCVSQFERSFKLRMETTFITYVNNLRIRMAIEFLEDETLSMYDIAVTCGFSNQYHFSRTFKKITQKSPTLFRKSMVR